MAGQPHQRSHLDRAVASGRYGGGPLQRFGDAGALQHVVAADDFLQLDERPIGDKRLALAQPQRACRARLLERPAVDKHAGLVHGLRGSLKVRHDLIELGGARGWSFDIRLTDEQAEVTHGYPFSSAAPAAVVTYTYERARPVLTEWQPDGALCLQA